IKNPPHMFKKADKIPSDTVQLLFISDVKNVACEIIISGLFLFRTPDWKTTEVHMNTSNLSVIMLMMYSLQWP
uniref:Uncharacterized protein n=1 Tax=Electrophorus electricus TaxID=8005 RepID=A0AAY5E924_ELEEL